MYSTNYLCNEFLDDTDRSVFERMKATNYRRYAVAGLGEWGVADGLVYENFEKSKFEFDNKGNLLLTSPTTAGEVSLEVESWKLRHFFGLDYGYTNDPTAFIAFAVNPIQKEIYIYDEHYEVKMLNSDIAEMIKQKGFSKERIRADSAEPKSNDDLRRLGITRIMPSVKGKDSVLNGIAQIQEYKIFVHPRCRNTIAELSGYCWKKDGDEQQRNEPVDKNNHLMDAMRYAFYDVKYFKPQNPERLRRKPTNEEYYMKKHGLDPKDIGFR